ncbi:MAG: tetratricopeptide repeat protein [Deltaproteobacteria bacterium]|nr:tetratricopeptide repeat protein [Deltaproteobacteria bacterium]
MWRRAPFLRRWARVGLAVLLAGGCAAKADPFGQQVQRIDEVSLAGEELFSRGELKRASRNFSRALTMSRSVDYFQGTAQQLNNLGAVALEEGDYQKARDHFTQAYDLNQDRQQFVAASINQANLATVAVKQGKPAEASQHLLTAQDAARQSRSPQALGRVYLQWASFFLDQNDPASAQDFLTRAQPLATTPELQGALFHHRGRLHLARGDTGQALEMFAQALRTDRSVLDRAAMAADLFYLGEAYQTRGDLAQAWDNYVRAFDVYAGLGKKAQLARCLKRLQEVNQQGRMGHTLERFEKLAQPGSS